MLLWRWNHATFIYYWWECKMVWLCWKTVWECLTKLTLALPYDSAIMFWGIYPNELKTYIPSKNLYVDVDSRFTHSCQNVEASKKSFSRWINCRVAIQWVVVLQQWKEVSDQARKDGGSKSILWSLEKLHSVWFQPCGVLRKVKLWRQ
jgi:hypothetical protein